MTLDTQHTSQNVMLMLLTENILTISGVWMYQLSLNFCPQPVPNFHVNAFYPFHPHLDAITQETLSVAIQNPSP